MMTKTREQSSIDQRSKRVKNSLRPSQSQVWWTQNSTSTKQNFEVGTDRVLMILLIISWGDLTHIHQTARGQMVIKTAYLSIIPDIQTVLAIKRDNQFYWYQPNRVWLFCDKSLEFGSYHKFTKHSMAQYPTHLTKITCPFSLD